jgi:hypothetical protein
MARAPPVADSNQRCGVRVTDERDRSRRARRGSGGESLAALGAATSQYGATVFCRHAGAKAMCTLALENAGLECPFHSSLRSTSSARVSAGMINRYVGCARHFRSSLTLITRAHQCGVSQGTVKRGAKCSELRRPDQCFLVVRRPATFAPVAKRVTAFSLRPAWAMQALGGPVRRRRAMPMPAPRRRNPEFSRSRGVQQWCCLH